MDYLRLTLALALPWAAGSLWLAAVERRFGDGSRNLARLLGYGFFLGIAGLQGIVLGYDALTGSVAFWPITLILGLTAAAGGTLLARGSGARVASPATGPAQPRHATAARLLCGLLLAWTALHLALNAIEIVHRPIFPWDAWLSWMYRAKAWFHAGAVLPMDSPVDWLRGAGTAAYNVPGNGYPTLPSIAALWSATALGAWREPLVNLPVLLCGPALALGFYGQSRATGLPRWASVTGVYLLLSIPLVGAHLSLGGMADIWMAGYAGLGLVALVGGLYRRCRRHIVLGLAMVALGAAVKNEGVIWLLAALFTLAGALWPRRLVGALVALVLAAGVAGLLGVHLVDLPLLGKLGVEDGRLYIPFLGNHALADFELVDDYFSNFFAGGSWHLLWPLVLGSLPAFRTLPPGPPARACVALLVALFLTQLLIFEGTEQGQWAEQWTAINRLPLHFAPALVFLLVLVAHRVVERAGPDRTGVSGRLAVPVLGLFIAAAGMIGYLYWTQPATGGEVRRFAAGDLRIAIGEGRMEGDRGIITGYGNGVALLSSGDTRVDTEAFRVLAVDTAGNRRVRVRFFWRPADRPEELQFLELGRPGAKHLDLGTHPGWRGQAVELGLLFFGDGGDEVAFKSLTLLPGSLAGSLQVVWSGWREPSFWSQKSANFLSAGAPLSAVPLPLAAAAWWAITALLALALARRVPAPGITVLLCAIAAWWLLDLRWTVNRLDQAAATLDFYAGDRIDYLDMGNDRALLSLAERATSSLGAGDRVLVAADFPRADFEVLRTRYHLLPLPAYGHTGPLAGAPRHLGDHLLLLARPAPGDPESAARQEALTAAVGAWSGRPASVVFDAPNGILFRLGEAAGGG